MDFPCLRQTHSGSCELMKWTDVCPVQQLSDLRCKRRTERWTTDGGYVLAIRRLDEHADRFLHGRSQPVHHSGHGSKVGPGEASRQHNSPDTKLDFKFSFKRMQKIFHFITARFWLSPGPVIQQAAQHSLYKMLFKKFNVKLNHKIVPLMMTNCTALVLA